MRTRSHESITDDLLFGRPKFLQVFVSSRMRHGLDEERAAVIEAIDSTRVARAWAWERDACAGPYSSEKVCIGQAGASDYLVLLIGGGDLTHIVYEEYFSAYRNGRPCYILIKEGARQTKTVKEFIRQQRQSGAVTCNFRNVSELQTRITDAIIHHTVQAARRDVLRITKHRKAGPR